MKISTIVDWIARLIAAVILFQTLFFKFSGAAESVYIFSTVGMEPWGRFGVGVVEFTAVVLLLINSTAWLGAVLAFSLMTGAIGMHLTILGIEVQGDGGYLFMLSIAVTIASLYVLFRNRERIENALLMLKRKIS